MMNVLHVCGYVFMYMFAVLVCMCVDREVSSLVGNLICVHVL